MMEWLEIIKTIADFGFTIVAAGFVIWELYNHRKRQDDKDSNQNKLDLENNRLRSERLERLIDNLESKQNDLYKLLIENQRRTEEKYDEIVTKMIECSQKPHIISAQENERMTKIDEEIDILLEKALIASKASRVSLIKYHNGGNDMLGNSILKMSMANERCAAGITHTQHNFQNQLRTFSTYLIKELNDNGKCFIKDLEDIKEVDNSLYQYAKQIGVQAKFVMSINDLKNDNVIGYLSIDFINKLDVNFEQVQHCLNDKKLKVEALLNIK